MSTFPNCPKLLKDAIVLFDPDSGAVRRMISLQYDPAKPTRTFYPHAAERGRP
jgi:hypothetical protein